MKKFFSESQTKIKRKLGFFHHNHYDRISSILKGIIVVPSHKVGRIHSFWFEKTVRGHVFRIVFHDIDKVSSAEEQKKS